MSFSEYYITESDKCSCSCCGSGSTKLDVDLLNMFKNLREYVGSPLHIESGYRCKKHNGNVGGSDKSRHLLGKAFDIHPISISPKELIKICLKLYSENKVLTGGLGLYRWGIHIDTCSKRLWDYR